MPDTDLARALGMERPINIRTMIKGLREELERFGPCTPTVHAHPTVPGRTTSVFYLNEEQAAYVTMHCKTEKATASAVS